ncbi:MAG: hypothetical protein NVS4B8_08620 [Herpetosiphon sp.]
MRQAEAMGRQARSRAAAAMTREAAGKEPRTPMNQPVHPSPKETRATRANQAPHSVAKTASMNKG